MATNNSMDPGLVSHGPSVYRKTSDLSRSLLSPDSFNSSQSFPDLISPREEPSTGSQSKIPAPIGPREEPSTGAQCEIPAPLDQFFEGAELGKALLMLSGSTLGALVGLMAFHQGVLPKQVVGAPVIMLLTGFFSLLSGLLFQKTCPAFAVVAVVGVGVPLVMAGFLTVVADILPPNLDPFVWVIASLMVAWSVFLLFFVHAKSKGIRLCKGPSMATS